MVVGSPTILNLIPSGVMPVVYINQGDAGYDKEFLVYNGDSPYNVPAGVSATIRGKKADGYGVTEAAALTEGSNLVTVTITEQMVAAAGENLYELVFVDTDGLRIATINMVWAVKKDALGDAVISESDLDYASQVMDQLQSVQAFKNQLDANTDGLAAETAARIAADNTLQSNINAEAAARAAAVNALQSSLSSEANTRAAQDTSLQAQINQIVAPSGSAPSAAEVQNARIGADGVTYSSLGDAIRTQDTNLSGRIDRISDATENLFVFSPGTFNGVKVEVLSDGGLRLTGTCTASVNARCAIPAFYGPYSLVVESEQTMASGALYVYLRNASGTQINVIAMSGTRQEINSTALSSNPIAMVDLTFISGKTFSHTIYVQLLNELAYKDFVSPYSAFDRVARSQISENYYIFNTPIISGTGYVKPDGNVQSDSGFKYKITDYIRTYEGCVYGYMGWGFASAYSVFYYDETKTLLSSEQYDSRTDYTEITIPAGCTFVRFASGHAAAFEVQLDVIVKSYKDRLQGMPGLGGSAASESDYVKNDVLYNKKWYALGDSFTHGDFTGITNPYIESGPYEGQLAVYPYLIGTRKKVNVQNMAVNGATIAESGDSSVYALSREGNYNSIPSDADYITIMIGINDSGKSIPIGTINDTSNTTFYGAWNTVLGWLRNNRPFAHVGIAISLSVGAEYRAAEIAVAKKYGYPYINLPEDETLPALLWASRANIDASIQTLVNEQQRCSASNFHPNGDAHKLLSTIIENWLYAI